MGLSSNISVASLALVHAFTHSLTHSLTSGPELGLRVGIWVSGLLDSFPAYTQLCDGGLSEVEKKIPQVPNNARKTKAKKHKGKQGLYGEA